MAVTRRTILTGSIALPLVHIGRAMAAGTVLKCSLSIAATHPLAIRLTEASKRIAEQTSGGIDLQIYPSAQLGGDVDVLSQTKSGAVQLQCIGGTTAAVMVPTAQIWVSLWKALGASPTMLDLSEVYSALQTKIVEGEENGVQLIETAKFYEVQKHCAMTNHQWDGWWMLGHKPTIDGLPDAQKEVLFKNLEQAVREERADIRDTTDATIKKLSGFGLAFNDIDIASFRGQLRSTSYYKDWQGKFGDVAWNALQNYTGALS